MPTTGRLERDAREPEAVERFRHLRTLDSGVVPQELDEVWASLPTVRAEAILGEWAGAAFQTGHPLCHALPASRWYGKSFLSLNVARPLVCRADDGSLFSNVKLGNGEATLWNVEFRGEVTATMVYDGRPIFDHFKRVDEATLMGIMNGKPELVLADGQHFYFLLERPSEG